MRVELRFALFLAAAAGAQAQWNPLNPVTGFREQPDGVLFQLQTGALRVQVCTEAIVHVLYSPASTFPARPDYVVTKTSWPAARWKMEDNGREVSLTTARLKVTVNRADAVVVSSDQKGKRLLTEGPKSMTPARVNGEDTYRSEDVFSVYNSREAFYGLGQQQAGVWNYRGELVELSEDNSVVAVPLLISSAGYGLFWNNPSRSRFNNRFVHALYMSSEVADTIDYYFIYGPELDSIVAAYRDMTGPAPLFGKWAYGFWQCKNRYRSQAEILDVAHKYRELHIPIDNIVQDWWWWTTKGSFVFNKNYPQPQAMIDDLHKNNLHLMISVWPFFDPGSDVYNEMDKRGYFVDKTKTVGSNPIGTALYDASNPEARAYYWEQMNKSLFRIGADAWWLDTTEPSTAGMEENILLRNKISIGSGARYANLYALETTTGVYQGQRAATDDRRVFILTRSGFAGVQRNAAALWSGDIASDFETYKRQIPAGLNLSLSGIPYWTTDIGGFFIGNPESPAYRELFVRWFQFGSFCPLFRVHGTRTNDPKELALEGPAANAMMADVEGIRKDDHNELWSYGPEAQKILVAFDRLRYRLMPYIYSVAWRTTSQGYTPMRALAMDFRTEERVLNIGDQFMFGPALLVNPVTEPGAASRHLYLPNTLWYDFWTGESTAGGKAIDAAAPLERLPLYVRAGSIVPMGPDVEYASAKAADPLEVRVYAGADGDFTLYEDENDTYHYEKGVYATIPLHWDNGSRTLTIGDRKGEFPGMLQSRSFHVIFVRKGRGTGVELSGKADRVVEYSGKALQVRGL
jgi:alpha-D-xyloside xylohydrolase